MTFDSVLALATPAMIYALVNLGKDFGIRGKWSALLAVILGVGLQLTQYYIDDPLVYEIAAGLTLGLTAAGVHDVTKKPTPEIAADYSELPDGTLHV
ncbi:hypothetical protein [Arcanobacterium canis]